VINGAATATGLVSLSLLPNTWPYFTQLDPFQVPAWLQPAQPGATFTGTPRMPSSSAATLLLCKLPNLGHLVIANEAGNQAGFFSELQRLSRLSSLDLMTGAPVQSKSLQVRAGVDQARVGPLLHPVLLHHSPSPRVPKHCRACLTPPVPPRSCLR
jgi:hypothetical protein